jgi:HAD superfamily hydrolase (TIGR01509 family)
MNDCRIADGVRASAIGLCFDLDGVLWDTSRIHEAAFNQVCRHEGLAPVPYECLAGRSTREAWSIVLDANLVDIDEPRLARLGAAKQELARRQLRIDPPVSADLPLLASIGPRNIPMALATGSSRETVEIFLNASADVCTFDVVVTAERVSQGKPAAEPYLLAARELGLDSKDCWVLEDSQAGLDSACAAGTRVVHLSDTQPCSLAHPTAVACVTDLRGFLRVIGLEEE